MRAGKNTDFAREITNLVGGASVAAFVFVQNAGAECFFLQIVERLGDFEGSGCGKFFQDLRFDLVLESFDGFVAIDFRRLINGGFDPRSRNAVGDLEEFVFHEKKGGLAFLFSVGSSQLFLDLDDRLDGLLGEFEGGLEFSFGEFFGTAFDHERFVFRANVNEVEIALGILVMGWIRDKFSRNACNANGGDGASPRDVGDHEGGGGSVEGKNIGIVLAVGAKKDGDDLSVVKIAFGKEGTKGAIDHPAGQDLFFGRATFPAEVASGDATYGGSFFLIFNGEREEVLAVFDFRGRDCSDDDDRFTHGDEGSAVGEFGEFSRFDVKVAVAQAGSKGFVVGAHSWMGSVGRNKA